DSGKELQRFEGQVDPVSRLAVSADGKRLLAAGMANTVCWDLTAGTELRRFPGKVPHFVALSDDGKRALAFCGDAVIRVWDVATGQELRRYPGRLGCSAAAVALSADGKRVLLGDFNPSANQFKRILLQDIDSGEKLGEFQYARDANCVSLSADG